MLCDHHGEQPWIGQLGDMIKEALQRGIEQIGHDGPVENAQPFVDGQPREYVMGARTPAEVEAEPAANARDLGEAPRARRVHRANRALDQGDAERFAETARPADPLVSLRDEPEESGEWLA